MQGTGREFLGQAKLVARVGRQGAFRHQLARNGASEFRLQASTNVDPRELVFLRLGLRRQLVPLAFQVCLFRVGLRADRDILASRH